MITEIVNTTGAIPRYEITLDDGTTDRDSLRQLLSRYGAVTWLTLCTRMKSGNWTLWDAMMTPASRGRKAAVFVGNKTITNRKFYVVTSSSPYHHKYTYNNQQLTLPEICNAAGVDIHSVHNRLENGVSLEDAVAQGLGNGRYTVQGVTDNVSRLCRHFGIVKRPTALMRMSRGWSVSNAVTVPKGKGYGKRNVVVKAAIPSLPDIKVQDRVVPKVWHEVKP